MPFKAVLCDSRTVRAKEALGDSKLLIDGPSQQTEGAESTAGEQHRHETERGRQRGGKPREMPLNGGGNDGG